MRLFLEKKRIDELFFVETGSTPSTKIKKYWINGNINWFTPKDLSKLKKSLSIGESKRKITKKAVNSSNLFLLPKRSILISTRAPVGYVAVLLAQGAFNQGCKGLIPKNPYKIDSYFYAYYLAYIKRNLNYLSSGSTFNELSKDRLKRVEVPFPPLSEQKKIAEILSTVDLAIEISNDAIKKINELRRGLAAKLFSQGIGHQKFKKTILGKIPYEWEIQKLDSLLELCQYGLSIKMDSSGKYPIIKMNSIKNGRVIHENLKYVNLKSKEFQKYKLEKGDILFNRTNSYELVGRTGVFTLDGDYVFASYLIRLRVIDKQIFSYFLALYLIFKNDQLRQMATRAVHQANINATNLKRFSVLVPSLKEQKEITEIFNSIDQKMELLQAKKEKLTSIKKGLMNDLLTGKKRVRLES